MLENSKSRKTRQKKSINFEDAFPETEQFESDQRLNLFQPSDFSEYDRQLEKVDLESPPSSEDELDVSGISLRDHLNARKTRLQNAKSSEKRSKLSKYLSKQ